MYPPTYLNKLLLLLYPIYFLGTTLNEVLFFLTIYQLNTSFLQQYILAQSNYYILSYPKNHDDIVYISAKKGINMDKLIEIIQDNIMKNTYAVTLMLPYERGDIFSRLKNKYNIENFEYVESGITLDVNLEEEDYNIYKEYILEK